MKRAIMGPKGIKSPSVKTLFELLQTADVPMGRAVLDIEKRLYSESVRPEDASETTKEYFMVEDAMEKPRLTLGDVGGETGQIASTPFSAAFVDTGAGSSSHVKHYMDEQVSYEESERPWRPGASSGPEFEIRKDLLFFRSAIPDLESPELSGYMKADAPDKKDAIPPYPEIGTLMFGVETALATTYRKGSKGQKVVLLEDEAAPLNAYLLFPAEVAPFMGTKRSGSLALDVMRGKEAMVWMNAILAMLGQIQEVNDAMHIVPLMVTGGNLAANIPLTDYLEGLVLQGMGIGDMLIDLGNYGFNELEFTPEILAVLITKIETYQGQLTTSINLMREALKLIPPATPNPMLPIETTPILDDYIREEAILVKSLALFEDQNPVLKQSDIARVAHFLKYYGDYWQVTIGKRVGFVIEERNRAIKTRDLERIQNAETERKNRAERGTPPTPNKCEHVAKLVSIRKIKGESEQYYALAKFLAHYQGERREDNWIPCNLCKKELLCVHERLLLKAYMAPLEREIVFKELNLNFSGGVFQGYYICRSCGQPIQEIGLDTALEFDSNGRPKVGRGILKQDDELSADDISKLLSVPVQRAEEYVFEDPDQMIYYRIIKELAERVGIYMERKTYKKYIRYLEGFMELHPDKDTFVALEKRYKKEREKEGKTHTIRNFDVVLAKTTICAAGILLLYAIQTHIPEYVPHYSIPLCDAGFGGYPLQEDRESRQGLTYIACAIAAVEKNEAPWNEAEFNKPVKGGEREKQIGGILKYMMTILADIEKTNSSLQQKLVDKRMWRLEQLQAKGLTGRLKDTVPSYFLPELTLPSKAEAAADPEGGGIRALTRAWIRNAHALARAHSNPVRGSPIADITCCKTSILRPGSFWLQQGELAKIALPGRMIQPLRRAPMQQFHFEARTQEATIMEVPKDLTYRLFMKVCPTGDRIGLPHEPGYTNLCHSCGFQFPGHPSIVDPDQAKEAIVNQKIDTSLEAFDSLLTTVHNKNLVAEHTLGEAERWPETMEAVRDMSPAPLDEWTELFRRTMRRLNRLKKPKEEPKEGAFEEEAEEIVEVHKADIIAILAESGLANTVASSEEFVKRIFAKKLGLLAEDLASRYQAFDIIAHLPWHNFIQVLETNFLKVGKNLLFQYDYDRLKKYRNAKLADSALLNIREAIEFDNQILREFSKLLNTADKQFAQLKLAKFVMQLTAIVRLKNRIRPIYFVGGQDTFEVLQEAFFYGPLAELFDSDRLPFDKDDPRVGPLPTFAEAERQEAEVGEGSGTIVKRVAKKKSAAASVADTSISLLVKIINASLRNFKQYQLSYNEKQLREILEARTEQEKQGMLSSLKAMSDEDRKIYRIQMNLKIGRFGVNVKKNIIGYSKTQVALEEKLNSEAGIAMSLSGFTIGDDEVEGWEEDKADAERTQEDIEQDQAYDNAEDNDEVD